MIDAFLQCPRKFYKQYILNEKDTTKSIDLEFGTALHLAISTHFEGGDPIAAFKMYWDSLDFNSIPSARFDSVYLSSLAISTFIPNFIRLHSKKITNVSQEVTLTSNNLSGTFDMLCDYEGVPTLIDWKTSAKEYPKSKIEKNPQLYIYAALCKANYGTVPKQIMYKVFIKSEGRIQTEKLALTDALLDRQMSNVYSIVKHIQYCIDNNTWYSNYNCFCRGCLK